jgi:predicted O-linked N-acetylglucosamine transferase (SPINDLY family)
VPLVTLPGEFARSRDAYEIYGKLGIDACTAADKSDYVRRAVAIASDRSLRNSIARAIDERSHMMFENAAAAHELEAFFIQAARGHES